LVGRSCVALTFAKNESIPLCLNGSYGSLHLVPTPALMPWSVQSATSCTAAPGLAGFLSAARDDHPVRLLSWRDLTHFLRSRPSLSTPTIQAVLLRPPFAFRIAAPGQSHHAATFRIDRQPTCLSRSNFSTIIFPCRLLPAASGPTRSIHGACTLAIVSLGRTTEIRFLIPPDFQ